MQLDNKTQYDYIKLQKKAQLARKSLIIFSVSPTKLLEFKRLLFNNYSPKWRWLAVVDTYRAAKRRGNTITTIG